jgi:hypothetical protein
VGWLVVPFKSGTAALQLGETLNLRFKGRLWEKLRLIREGGEDGLGRMMGWVKKEMQG